MKTNTKQISRLKKQYIRVIKMGDKYNCYLQIDHQGFNIVEETSKQRANWYAKMLAIALDRMISKECLYILNK